MLLVGDTSNGKVKSYLYGNLTIARVPTSDIKKTSYEN